MKITKERLQELADEFDCELDVYKSQANDMVHIVMHIVMPNNEITADYNIYMPKPKWHWPAPQNIDDKVFCWAKGYSVCRAYYGGQNIVFIDGKTSFTTIDTNHFEFIVLANPDDLSQVPTEEERKEIEGRQ